MKSNPLPKTLQRQVLTGAMAAALSLTAAGPLHAATPKPAKAPVATAPAAKPAQQCLTDLSAFHTQLQKDGYWQGASGYSYGYPMNGYGYYGGVGSLAVNPADAPSAEGYARARPGYEVRTLLAAAQILAQRGQQAPCEALLGETRQIYARYAEDMRSGNAPRDDPASYRQALLAAAQPVTGRNVAYRSDQLIGTEVLNLKGEELGSVDDLVLSPRTGQISYLVIARGGLFGIGEKHVPVPWGRFKATTDAKVLVLDTTKADLTDAPHVSEDRWFSAPFDFAKQSQEVDAYWSAHSPK